jgi:hypothetical protein
MARLMRSWENGWERGKWLQYKGWRKEGLFIGIGEQNEKRHAVLCVSGGLSQRLLPSLKSLDGWYCTRLDLQETIEEPDYIRLAEIRDECTTKNTTLIESLDNDTLYLGSRTSEIFTRLYEKPLDRMMLRLEFELKGGRAKMAWRAMLEGETADMVFSYYMEASKLPEDVLRLFATVGIERCQQIMRDIALHDIGKTLKWIESLDASMEKYMNNHEIGEQVKTLVRAWAAYADKLDKT